MLSNLSFNGCDSLSSKLVQRIELSVEISLEFFTKNILLTWRSCTKIVAFFSNETIFPNINLTVFTDLLSVHDNSFGIDVVIPVSPISTRLFGSAVLGNGSRSINVGFTSDDLERRLSHPLRFGQG